MDLNCVIIRLNLRKAFFPLCSWWSYFSSVLLSHLNTNNCDQLFWVSSESFLLGSLTRCKEEVVTRQVSALFLYDFLMKDPCYWSPSGWICTMEIIASVPSKYCGYSMLQREEALSDTHAAAAHQSHPSLPFPLFAMLTPKLRLGTALQQHQ